MELEKNMRKCLFVNVLSEPKVVIHKSLEGSKRLISGCSSVASKGILGAEQGTCRTHSDA